MLGTKANASNCHCTSVNGSEPCLLEHYWLKLLAVNISPINANTTRDTADPDQVLLKHAAVFELGFGRFNGPAVRLEIN